ncbi:MAG: nucleotidyltransferase family protein [Anaerolineales bacterium]|nr:nucleotidyltransferase family protein [Anaerolineales bacterium]
MTALAQLCDTLAAWLNPAEAQNPHWSAAAWQTFQFASRVHGVAPLLHIPLAAASWLDESTRSWLDEQYQLNSQRLTRMQTELQEILALFNRRHIPLLPLKGSILAPLYYPDPGLRPMADLDVLIHPADFAASARLLAELGYRQETVHWKHTEFCKPDNRQVVSTSGEHPDNPRKLELHLRCRETFGGPTVELTGLMWANAAPGTLLGQPALLPRPEALWLHLLVHATYHIWQGKGRLIHLYDLALLVPHLDDPWPWLEAVDGRFTYPALALLKKYFPAAVEDSLLAAQHRRVSASFRRWVDSLDLVNTSHLNPQPPGPYLFRAIKFSEGRPREVAQALRFALLPSLDEIALDHPHLAQSRAPWLAYFLLPLDWVKRLNVQR